MTEATDVALFSELVSEGTTRYIVETRRRGDEGGQIRYRFPNDMGASVVRYGWYMSSGRLSGTYGAEDGLFELAVIRFTGAGGTEGGEMDQEHPLVEEGGGVRGWLTAQQVEEILLALKREPVTLAATEEERP